MAKQSEFGYSSILLLKEETLGAGAYGRVCKAKCDGLLCAAKIMHPTLFDMHDPGAITFLEKFSTECHLLSLVRHPNIVQYLATYRDPETRLPVLLMELCDESLTKFLERSPGPLPYHIELNISHDIVLALVYLHSNGLIHRDLTSNNVLMIAGVCAKVTDFGMSKLASVNPRMTPMTACPGNLLYMSPEALQEPPSYTDKLDTFSLGVLLVQIMVRKFPEPTERFQIVNIPNDSRFPGGMVNVPVPDVQRRKAHLDLINSTHNLKVLALKCLNNKEKERPSAIQLNSMLSDLKSHSRYAQSVRMVNVPKRAIKKDSEDAKEAKIAKYQQENIQLQGKIAELNQKIFALEGELEKQQVLSAANLETIQSLQRVLEDKEQEMQMNRKSSIKEKMELQDIEKSLSQLCLTVERRDSEISDLRKVAEEMEKKAVQNAQQPVAAPNNSKKIFNPPQSPVLPPNATINFDKQERIWCTTYFRGSMAVNGSVFYINPAETKEVFSYQTSKGWISHPPSFHTNSSLAVIDGLLTSIGGWSERGHSKSLYTLTNSQWSVIYPAMLTARSNMATASTDDALVVAGGYDGNRMLSTVEVMSMFYKQWSLVSSLPHPLSKGSATVSGNRFFLSGGYIREGEASKSVLTCSLADLNPHRSVGRQHALSIANASLWQPVQNAPVTQTTLTTLNGNVLAVGGCDASRNSVNTVYMYVELSDEWKFVGKMRMRRRLCLAITLSEDRVYVLGGMPWTNNMESGSLHISRMRV